MEEKDVDERIFKTMKDFLLLFVGALFYIVSCSNNPLEEQAIITVQSKEESVISSVLKKPFYYHYSPNSFIKDADGHNAIASESVDDIKLAARLGFDFIEANIHQTADGYFVCTHGSNGTFGKEVKSVDESVITTEELRKTAINSVSLDFIESYVRYDSYYEKYQTSIPTLEEFCRSCVENNIGLFAGTGNLQAIEICRNYLGDNLIVYGFPSSIRLLFNGFIYSWNNITSINANDLIQNADVYGNPYICGIGPTLLREMKEEGVIDNFITSMHSKGHLVGIAAVYQTEEDVRDAIRRGVDFFAAGHEVNPFEANYEQYSFRDGYRRPTTTGHITNGIVALSASDSILCGSKERIIGKGYLTIKFKGSVTISFGSRGSINRSITSDGSELIEISDYFFERQTVLTITANEDTTVSEFTYITSKC